MTKQQAFVVVLEIDQRSHVDELAADLLDDLESQGYTVLSVNPWDTQTGTQTPDPFAPPLA